MHDDDNQHAFDRDNVDASNSEFKSQADDNPQADNLKDVAQTLIRGGYIPVSLKPHSKVPAGGNGWQRKAVADAAKTNWSKVSGLGVLGGYEGLVPIDIDTDDPEALAAIHAVLPPTNVKKKGKRGETWFYRASEPIDARRLKDKDGSMLCEVLTSGQTVLPPTIHPETGRPYVWTGTRTLLDTAAAELPEITPAHIEALREALKQWLPEKVPKPITGQGLKKTGRKRYEGAANAALKGEVETLTATESGGRNHQLYVSTCKLGKWFYNGIVRREDLERLLLEACEENGLAQDDGEAQCMSTIESGLWKSRDDFLPELEDRKQTKDQPGVGIAYIKASDVKPEAVTWLWKARLARGKMTMVAGDPGVSKSTQAIDTIARLTTGRDWPAGEGKAPLGSVAILSSEDAVADTIVPRLIAAGADLDRVKILQAVRTENGTERGFNLKSDLDALDTLLDASPDIIALFVDPVTSYVGDADSNSTTVMRGVLDALAKLAEKRGIAVWLVHHLRKPGSGDSIGRVMHRVLGSQAFIAACRVVFAVIDDAEVPGRRLFLVAKPPNNAPPPQGLTYTVEGVALPDGIATSRVVWGAAIDKNADQVAQEAEQSAKTSGTRKAILEVLEDADEPLTPKQVHEALDIDANYNTVKQQLRRMTRASQVKEVGGGFYSSV